MIKKNSKLGPLEMEVMGVFKDNPEMTVTEVQKKLRGLQHELAYTTVMTILSRLYKKGFLKRNKQGRQFFYSQADSMGVAQLGTNLLTKVRRALFKNRMLEPVLALLEDDSELSERELIKLKNIVDKKIKEMKKNT
ncbi:MAG TPA: BlaI/MecI/CopY family transcriptional regulator [Bdellovibrionota bacterium]|nr:BlaI/MecI/CopY family transcriptional regulator [Bdellovibrionota bacterium]